MNDLENLKTFLGWVDTAISCGDHTHLKSQDVNFLLARMSHETASLASLVRDHVCDLLNPWPSMQGLLDLIRTGQVSAKYIDMDPGEDLSPYLVIPEDFPLYKRVVLERQFKVEMESLESEPFRPYVILFDLRAQWIARMHSDKIWFASLSFSPGSLDSTGEETLPEGAFESLVQAIQEGQIYLENLRRNAKEWLKSPEVMNEIRMLRREADEIIPLPQDIPSTPFAGEVADPMSDILEDYKNGIRENS